MIRSIMFVAALLCACSAAGAQQPAVTEVVILGVEHSAQLVNRRQQPAALRALFTTLRPSAVCIERTPERVARRDHYEFTYEIQNVIIPWAAETRTPLCPFDWMPPPEDTTLAFGIDDLERPPLLRAPSGFLGFVTFDAQARDRRLFYADATEERERNRAFYLAYPDAPAGDFARRLYLYRTFLQARRIAAAARNHPGGRILVVVGTMHKDDIERILAADPRLRVTQPSTLAAEPDAAAIARHQQPEHLFAIATLNLLGVQSRGDAVDLDWIDEVVRQLQRDQAGPETELLATRLAERRNRIATDVALAAYMRVAASAGDRRFTWDGVKERSRVDSAFDPFGNLTVAQRARIEAARIHLAAGRTGEAEAIRTALRQELATPLKQAQLDGYWPVWVAVRL